MGKRTIKDRWFYVLGETLVCCILYAVLWPLFELFDWVMRRFDA